MEVNKCAVWEGVIKIAPPLVREVVFGEVFVAERNDIVQLIPVVPP